jgi:spermidine synthase
VRALCGAVFVGSGLAALMYQVIWQRILAIFSGADVFSVTIIVAAFMAGLGLGSLAGGQIADRVTARTSLMLFGFAELAIAAFGYFSARLYYDLLYTRLGAADLTPMAMAAVIFASLLLPTILMGGSLPLLARAMTDRLDHAASTIGNLYGLNTLGAATGALVATWWLLPTFGLEESLRIAAMVNAACALVVLPLAFASATAANTGATPAAEAPRASVAAFPTFAAWVAIYAFAGFLALSFEIVWFRTLGVMMKSTAFTFGTLLTLYLGGLGLGSMAGTLLARRISHHAGAFLALQAASGLVATGLIAVLVGLADEARALRGYFGSYEPIDAGESLDGLRAAIASLFRAQPDAAAPPANFLRFYVVIPALLVVPPTFLMGCSFPVLQRVVQTDLGSIGRRVGTLLLANIAGSVAGTMVTGWLLLDFLGTPATLKLLTAMSGGFALMAVTRIGAGGGPSAFPEALRSGLGCTARQRIRSSFARTARASRSSRCGRPASRGSRSSTSTGSDRARCRMATSTPRSAPSRRSCIRPRGGRQSSASDPATRFTPWPADPTSRRSLRSKSSGRNCRRCASSAAAFPTAAYGRCCATRASRTCSATGASI